MAALKIYNRNDILNLVNKREGEIKLGEKVQVVNSLQELKNSSARFVLLGIPEDIGIRANHGITGAASTWLPTLKAILNVQSNSFLDGEALLVLGHFNFTNALDLPESHLNASVSAIDAAVYPVIQQIVMAGKVPIVIGGGHNNAYPIIKGLSLALQQPLNVLNIDAHADLRPATGRHSGNGFSYAIENHFLEHYAVFGLHQSYNNQKILDTITDSPNIEAVFFDDLLKQEKSWTAACQQLVQNMENSAPENATGLEIDLDCIENMLSSAFTPSGFNINDIRRIILSLTTKLAYMHICEGAVTLADGRNSSGTAKAIAYLVTDFIKAQETYKSDRG